MRLICARICHFDLDHFALRPQKGGGLLGTGFGILTTSILKNSAMMERNLRLLDGWIGKGDVVSPVVLRVVVNISR